MTTIFLARLQPMHQGHKKVIEKKKEEYSDFILVLGSADKSREQKNPLNVEERKEIVKSCFPNLEIGSIEDETRDEEGNKKWADQLEQKFKPERIISRNELVKEIFKDRDVEVIRQDQVDRDVYSGTEVRRRIRSGEEWRYLTPECARETIEKYTEIFKKTGIQYEFKPGWKRENSFYNTLEDKKDH